MLDLGTRDILGCSGTKIIIRATAGPTQDTLLCSSRNLKATRPKSAYHSTQLNISTSLIFMNSRYEVPSILISDDSLLSATPQNRHRNGFLQATHFVKNLGVLLCRSAALPLLIDAAPLRSGNCVFKSSRTRTRRPRPICPHAPAPFLRWTANSRRRPISPTRLRLGDNNPRYH